MRNSRIFHVALFLLLIWAGFSSPVWARKAVRTASVSAIIPAEQDALIKKGVLEFLKKNPERRIGEGWLFLARHYREMGDPDRSRELIKTLLRSVPVPEEVKWDAQLLLAQILVDQKEYDSALKEFDRLIDLLPVRKWRLQAKIERAQLLSRQLTRMPDLYKAFQRYVTNFPEQNEGEEIRYLMGFERGYDLEIAMKGMEAWEELSKYPEEDVADLARLNLGLIFAFDFSKPERSEPFLASASPGLKTQPALDTLFVRATINQFYKQPAEPQQAIGQYRDWLKKTQDLAGWRVGTMLSGLLLAEPLQDPQTAIEVFSSLASTPPHLLATPSISLKKRQEVAEEDKFWALLGWKMAGYSAEFRVRDPDRARACYVKAQEVDKSRVGAEADFWVLEALRRTEPKAGSAEWLFEQAYEKYRGRDLPGALQLWESFVASYPNHSLAREALYRTAVVTDDDLRQFDQAIDLYNRYLIKVVPQKSAWELDKIYDWGRIDEVRYRIGNLLALHRKDPVGAVKIFAELGEAYPDSYWAMQGLKDTARLQREVMGDEGASRKSIRLFLQRYPDSQDAQKFRRELAELLVGEKDFAAAAEILEEFLQHGLPSDEGYLLAKKEYRALSVQVREKEIRDRMAIAGNRDVFSGYRELIPVFRLATASDPLEKLASEIQDADMPDDQRWGLVYQIGTELYEGFPGRAKELFTRLAENSSGSAKIACLLTLGNIAYRIDKSLPESIRLYEAAASETAPLSAMMESPFYRLGRLYLATGLGEKGIKALTDFSRQYPRSRHLANAYSALGDACLVLHRPNEARRFWTKALRLQPLLAPKLEKKVAESEKTDLPDVWVAKQAEEREKKREEERERLERLARGETASGTASNTAGANGMESGVASGPLATVASPEAGDVGSGTIKGIDEKASPETLYGSYLEEQEKPKPDWQRSVSFLQVLLKKELTPKLHEKVLRHYLSWRIFRASSPKDFVTEAQEMLTRRNYPDNLSELLYRLGQIKETILKDFEGANKTNFEYLSFFPEGKRVLAVRERIPQVYERAQDVKNALRFYEKLISDSAIPAKAKVDASLRKAKIEEIAEQKEEAIKTLEAALSFESARRPELYMQLEKLTDDFEYVRKALDTPGEEKYRFEALKRLLKKAEEDQEIAETERLIKDYQSAFSGEEAVAWLKKKAEDLQKRDSISEIEARIEGYPEEAETPARLFKLAQMVEGMDNTKYRAQDLFYEITLMYPKSQFYRESKIRAENQRVIKSVEQIGDLLKKGVKTGEGDELLLQRARLYRESLQDQTKAREDYEALLKLFPDSPRRDEAYLGLGFLALNADRDAPRALELWEKGLQTARDPETRRDLAKAIDDLKEFREKVLYSEQREDHEKGRQVILRLWRLERDRDAAMGLVREALGNLENRPQFASLQYLLGLMLEESGKPVEAFDAYEKALRSLNHPGCRKDRILYRQARLLARQEKAKEAYDRYVALVTRYPQSRFSRSGFYWLYKQDLGQERFSQAHDRLSRLLNFRTLFPSHRKALKKLQVEVAARMNLAGMNRLKGLSKAETGATFHYYIGKVLENDLHDGDRAIAEYKKYLASNPPISRSRDLLLRMANIAEKKGDYLHAVGYLDTILRSLKVGPENLDLILRIGNLLEDKVGNAELIRLFFENIREDYRRVKTVNTFVRGKLRSLERIRMAKAAAARPKAGKPAKREYSADDEEVLNQIDEIQKKEIADLQDFTKAERELVALWDENPKSLASFDILKVLVDLNENQLLDPQKAAEYYDRWLGENPDDPAYGDITMKLYELYMEKVRDGQKALRLLEAFINTHGNHPLAMEAQLKLGKANELLVLNYNEAQRIYQRLIDTRRNEPIVHEAFFRMGFVMRNGFANYAESIRLWTEMNDLFYNNAFAAEAQFEIGATLEYFIRDFAGARAAYEKLLSLYPNSPLQNRVREALLRISNK